MNHHGPMGLEAGCGRFGRMSSLCHHNVFYRYPLGKGDLSGTVIYQTIVLTIMYYSIVLTIVLTCTDYTVQ